MAVCDRASSGSPRLSARDRKRHALEVYLLSPAWCGLVAGLLEVAAIVIRKQTFDANRLYGMSRHSIWLIPVTNLALFAALGLPGWLAAVAWPRLGARLFARLLCALTLWPMLLIAVPRVYAWAWFVLALGIATWLLPRIEARQRLARRVVRVSFPLAVAAVLLLAAAPWVSDRIEQSRESARSLPPPGSQNVILIVLDTVAAGHLEIYGYSRRTSTTLGELADRGIRFDSAIAPSSWTLASHATMFTGRWLHELSVGWLSPLDNRAGTLAEVLAARGYATAGFVANTMYCARDTGLARGFTHYDDYILPELTGARTAVLVSRALAGVKWVASAVDRWPELAWLRAFLERLWSPFVSDRKGAAVVNRQFLDWLSRREQRERPFFAFLNLFDAHVPYEVPPGRMHRFGIARPDNRQRLLIERWGDLDKARLSPYDIAIAVDAYDDCIADLDEQLGKLIDELDRQGIMQHTWLIVTSDHGESFGEHPGVFCHGTSLYRTELHVPLLMVPPGGSTKHRVVSEAVSLRDLPATIVDVLGVGAGSPFPGSSLARYWNTPATPGHESPPPALAELVPGDARYRDSYGLPQKTWPMAAINDGDWSYIRSEGNVREELFRVSRDAAEQHNLARDTAMVPVLDRMRASLGRLTGGPLTPRRFSR